MSILLLLRPRDASAPPPPGTDTLYLRDSLGTPLVKPADFLGSWLVKSLVNVGATARALVATSGANGAATHWDCAVTVDELDINIAGCAQLLSPALAAQAIGAGSWTVALAGKLAATDADFTLTGRAALYLVNGATGAIRTAIFAPTNVGSPGHASDGAIYTAFGTVAGGAATATAGDYLALEVGLFLDNGGTTAAVTAQSWGNGDDGIGSNNAANADPQAHIVAPAALVFA